MPAMQNEADELTGNGILTDHPDITRLDLERLHGEPRHESDSTVVFADTKGYAFDEWGEVFGDDFSERMHVLAREFTPNDGIDHWPAAWPLAFDARMFDETDGTATECDRQTNRWGDDCSPSASGILPVGRRN